MHELGTEGSEGARFLYAISVCGWCISPMCTPVSQGVLRSILSARFFFGSCAALIMTMVTVLDIWRLCASNAILQKKGIPSDTKKQQKPPQQTNHKNQTQPRYSPWGETVKLALSDVNPALSTSLPTNSSAVLSDTLVAFLQALAIGAFDDGPSFLRLFVALPSLRLSCSSASWYVTSIAISVPIDDLQDVLYHCVLIDKPDNPGLGSLGFYLFFVLSHFFHACQCDVGKTESWTSSPGRHGRLRISNSSRRPAW